MPPEPEYVFSDPLPLTGERTAPGIPEENYWFQRHVIAYEWTSRRVAGLRVLDAGCGEGYGTDMLAGTASEVVGVDLETGVVHRATARYPSATFQPADLTSLPYPDASFDAVVSLQVIEHVRSPLDYCAEVARVLRPGGEFLCATPNRLTFSPEGIRNPFHLVEFSPVELRGLLSRHFAVDEMFGTFHAGRIRAGEIATRSSFPERLIETPVPNWTPRMRAAVARVTTRDFRIRAAGLDKSLDLIAVGRR